ncbi:MAG TPA: hypothetical protein VGD48_31050 [Kutzneria sp.]|jgi:hypothetical protein
MVKTAQMAVVGTALVLGGLLTACTGDPGTPGPTTTSAAAPTTTTTAPTATTTSRNLALPPGVGPFPNSICTANIYSNGMVNGLTGYYNQVKKGRTVSDAGWQDMQTTIPDIIASSSGQRAAFEQAGVPSAHPVYHDIDELLAAMNAVGVVAKAKDNSGLVPAFERLRTANQLFIDSCGAITHN